VEFLTGNRGSDEYLDKPADMPAGASADPIRFLDFLIYSPVRTILLHNSGVSVIVPDPARFAVDKIIVTGRRPTETTGTAKRDKELRQAMILFEALIETGRGDGLAAAVEELLNAGRAGDLRSKTALLAVAVHPAKRPRRIMKVAIAARKGGYQGLLGFIASKRNLMGCRGLVPGHFRTKTVYFQIFESFLQFFHKGC
jgi:hypothetical protein